MAKRFTKPSIVWAEVEKRVPANQRANYFAFKAKSDGYLRRVQSYPEEPPKIDWDSYQKSVPVSGLVDKFKSAYESFKVPYPDDTVTKDIDAQWSSLQTEIKDFCDKSEKRIEEANKELTRIKALPKFDDMTMEMYYELSPKDAIDFRQSFWPHNPEEQVDYVPPKVEVKQEKK